MKLDTKKLAISAMIITLDVIFTRLLAINTPLMKIGFGFAAVALAAMMFGPIWAMFTAALGDFVGSMIFPVGPFFPGFTLTAALTGLIFGLCLYNKRGSKLRPIIAAALNCLLVTLIANTALIAYISGNDYSVLFTTRIVQFLVMFPVQSLVLLWLNNSGVVDVLEGKNK